MGQLRKILKSKLSKPIFPKRNKNWKNLASKMGFSVDRINCSELMENQARNKQRGEKIFQREKCTGTPNFNS